ncbi:hypothetical protein CEXT_45581 [Caerostris extrusa]|uniref:Uncharacterized protein n=1 Tax=Caerostris extrusa TaxID=172846 RepID=A0AAV4NH64_CAEEX|nr:hypothetical protein CEXT_45581 [Caerostris extrusa]
MVSFLTRKFSPPPPRNESSSRKESKGHGTSRARMLNANLEERSLARTYHLILRGTNARRMVESFIPCACWEMDAHVLMRTTLAIRFNE